MMMITVANFGITTPRRPITKFCATCCGLTISKHRCSQKYAWIYLRGFGDYCVLLKFLAQILTTLHVHVSYVYRLELLPKTSQKVGCRYTNADTEMDDKRNTNKTQHRDKHSIKTQRKTDKQDAHSSSSSSSSLPTRLSPMSISSSSK